MMNELKDSMKPMMAMAEINKKTAEALIGLQSSYVTDVVNASLSQMKSLTEVKDPKAALELQVKYLKEAEAKMTEVAEKEIAALAAAKAELTELMEQSVEDYASAPMFEELKKFMSAKA
ncbi:MAG: phasin family protein [Marinobacterium sp.]|jgi:phasin family protein